MRAMISALFRAFAQLADPPIQKVIWSSVLGALGSFILVAVIVWIGLDYSHPYTVWWINTMVSVLGGFAVLGLTWLLFPAVVVTIAGLLLEPVARAVERRYYPDLLPPMPTSWFGDLIVSLRFLVLLLVVNFLALPLYLVPIGNFVVFYGLNGYLLSREYFDMVARRRVGAGLAKEIRRLHRLRLLCAGIVIAFLSTLPMVNLVVPVIATAFMVHVFQGLATGRRPFAGT
ncbi:MAG: EI24 domain-containing protein [Azospirillaceae bacterium]|nr:EI24 domain-containing protein [Azospirillaceae bacterium]